MAARADRVNRYNIYCDECSLPGESDRLLTPKPVDSVEAVQIRDMHNKAFHSKGGG